MNILRAGDTISGQAGVATAVIDGNIEDMFYLKSLEATIDKRKTVVKALGSRGDQNKSVGFGGTGNMTINYMTSIYRKQLLKFVKTGVDTNFTITITNNDEMSTIGKQTTVLYNVNIDGSVVAKLDVDSDNLDETVNFTFDSFELLDEFGKPII